MAENCPYYRNGKCDNPTDSRKFDCSFHRPDYEQCSVYVLITDPARGRQQLLTALGGAGRVVTGAGASSKKQTTASPYNWIRKKTALVLLIIAGIVVLLIGGLYFFPQLFGPGPQPLLFEGKVTQQGRPVSVRTIYLAPADKDGKALAGQPRLSAKTDFDGELTLNALPGTYRVYLDQDRMDTKEGLKDRFPAEYTRIETTPILLELEAWNETRGKPFGIALP